MDRAPLSFWGPVPRAFTPHGGSPETVPATSTDTQAVSPQDLECWWLADSALQWKSARIPWLEVNPGRSGKQPEVALKLLNARSLTVQGNGVTLFRGGRECSGSLVGYGIYAGNVDSWTSTC